MYFYQEDNSIPAILSAGQVFARVTNKSTIDPVLVCMCFERDPSMGHGLSRGSGDLGKYQTSMLSVLASLLRVTAVERDSTSWTDE